MEGFRRTSDRFGPDPLVIPYQDCHAYITGRREGRVMANGFDLLDQSEDRIEGDEHCPPEGCVGFKDPFEAEEGE